MCILVVFFLNKNEIFLTPYFGRKHLYEAYFNEVCGRLSPLENKTIFLNVLTKIINLEILQIFCQHVFDWRKCSYSGRWSEDERYPTHATRWPCAPQCSHANGND